MPGRGLRRGMSHASRAGGPTALLLRRTYRTSARQKARSRLPIGGAMKSRKLCSIRIIGWKHLPEGDGHPQILVHDDLHAARDRGPSRSEEPSAGEPALALLSRVGDDRFRYTIFPFSASASGTQRDVRRPRRRVGRDDLPRFDTGGSGVECSDSSASSRTLLSRARAFRPPSEPPCAPLPESRSSRMNEVS